MVDDVEIAPAVEVPAAPVTATVDAANRDDFSAFEKADFAKRSGAPLPDVAPAKPVEHKISNRQQALNDAAAKAAESATVTLREENARLKAQLEQRAAPAPTSVKPAPVVPTVEPTTLAEFVRKPDVSKPMLTEAEFFAKFPDAEYGAHARYGSNYDRHMEAVEARQHGDAETVDAAQREQLEGFVKQLRDAEAADPTFRESISPLVGQRLKPFEALQPGEQGGPINVIGAQVYASDAVPQMLKFFSTPAGEAELTRITTMPAHLANQPPALRGKNHIEWMIREYGKLEARVQGESPVAAPAEEPAVQRTTTALAPPPPTISKPRSSSDPKKSALARGDFAAFEAADLAERVAKRNAG